MKTAQIFFHLNLYFCAFAWSSSPLHGRMVGGRDRSEIGEDDDNASSFSIRWFATLLVVFNSHEQSRCHNRRTQKLIPGRLLRSFADAAPSWCPGSEASPQLILLLLPSRVRPNMIKLIHHAVDFCVTFLDTSDMYGPHNNEISLGKALKGGLRQKVELATEFGISFADGRREFWGDLAYMWGWLAKRLNIDCIDIYYQRLLSKSPSSEEHRVLTCLGMWPLLALPANPAAVPPTSFQA
ncbi:hypothetical protein BT93_I0380 [Corymbia citriodora subsp. variegata]|nr:hypothetical protein BT93_I0380 [Corymbia citriodora subsp. variegata]